MTEKNKGTGKTKLDYVSNEAGFVWIGVCSIMPVLFCFGYTDNM